MQSNGMDSCSTSHVEHIDVPRAHVFMFFNFSMHLLTKHTVADLPRHVRRLALRLVHVVWSKSGHWSLSYGAFCVAGSMFR